MGCDLRWDEYPIYDPSPPFTLYSFSSLPFFSFAAAVQGRLHPRHLRLLYAVGVSANSGDDKSDLLPGLPGKGLFCSTSLLLLLLLLLAVGVSANSGDD